MLRLIKRLNTFSSLKPRSVKILNTQGNDIYFNLALQQYLFETAKIQVPTLFLWRNSPTIVIGKHQNPWKQCKVEQMKQDGIKLSRRKTGGGAVYQDLGNTCFSFLTPYDKDDKLEYRTVNNQIILEALSKLGVKAEVSGRNDLVTDGKKFSGSAYRLHLGGKDGTGKKSLHHGTIMFSVDFNALQKYLNPNKKKLESKGIDSVISRVINLNEHYPNINHNSFCTQLTQTFINYYGNRPHKIQTLDPSLHQQTSPQSQKIKQNQNRLKSWQWLYGQCPYFKYTIENKFPWGLIEITFQVQNAIISKCKIYSDSLFPDWITTLNQNIIGVHYDTQGLAQFQRKLATLDIVRGNQMLRKMGVQLVQWICSQI